MKRVSILCLATIVAMLAGCATTNEHNDVSSIPWNRPATWEGQGALGGFRPPGSDPTY
jgi:ABC-type uncharacterized transport system auxiliary subunit